MRPLETEEVLSGVLALVIARSGICPVMTGLSGMPICLEAFRAVGLWGITGIGREVLKRASLSADDNCAACEGRTGNVEAPRIVEIGPVLLPMADTSAMGTR